MSDSETPRGVLQTISKRNILEALTGSRSEKVPPVPSVAEQKIARQVLEKKKMMESKLEVLSDRRDLITERLIRMKESLKGDGINIHLLNLHLETLRRCADDFDKIRVEISALLPKEQRIIARQEYEVFEDIHNELYVDLQTRIAQSQEASRITPGMSNSLSIPGPQQPIIVQAAAPQLHAPFPTFDGTPENWYSFKSLFKSIMAKYPNETPAMKILHLRNSLEGDAKSKIDQNVVNNNDYEKAWKILENAYEDRRLILDTHIDAILGCANVNKENRGKSISELVETCSKHVDALEGHSYPVEGLGELILLNVLYKKLDKETQEQWEMKVPKGEVPEYEMFIEFLRERGRVLERTNRSQQQVQQSTFQPKQRFAVAGQRASAQSSKSFVQTVTEACPCCQAEHTIYKCQKFQNMDFLERKSVAAKAGLCYNCLKQRHRVNDCQSDQGCKVQGCGRKHHSLLHPNDEVRQNQPETRSQSPAATDKDSNPAQQERSGPCATTMCAQIDLAKRQVLLSTAVVLIVGHGGVPVKCRALLDSGSDSHVLSEKLANQLMLKKNRIDIPISGLNDIQTKVKYVVSTQIRSRVNSYTTSELDFLVVPKITSSLPLVEVDTTSWKIPEGVKLADPSFHVPGEVDLIIGNEIFFDLVKIGRLKLENSAITFAETELGWVAGGSVQVTRSTPRARICQFSHQERNLNETMAKFWEIEDVRLGSSLSAAEAAVEEHFKETHARDEQGRYIVRLPFNDKKSQLGDSFVMAKKRYERLMISLAKNPEKRMQYAAFMAEYIDLGHMKEADDPREAGYYIPHHAVYKASSSTTKTRVVFDASAKTTSGVSLNDTVMVGPTVQSDLVEVIMRFCGHQVVLAADVPKMYRQIGMHPDDCKYQRVLWCNDQNDMKVFELQTVTYGVASSPYHATKALMQLVEDEGEEFPLASAVIKKDSYVDDFLTGGESVRTVITTYQELSELLGRGGFGVHKFCSNSQDVLATIPKDLQEQQVSFEESGVNNTIKTLGLIWNPSEDYFVFRVQPVSENISSTKREVLSDIGRLFDPLGFLGPIIALAKMIMQDIWRLRLGWDELLPDALLHQWKQFRDELPTINQKQKRRCVVREKASWIELHGFSDASKRAFGAVVYIRSITSDGIVEVKLVASKSRVAPLKPLTIPRLELCGAKLLAELVQKVTTSMAIHFDEVNLWCDSQIVLCWLKKSPLALNQFVANRVAAILELTPGCSWLYVQSEQNPADIISRGTMPNELVHNDMWWNGPSLLWQSACKEQDPEEWDETELPELKPAKCLAIISKNLPITFDRVSDFRKLQRAWAYVMRFINLKKEKRVISVTAEEMRNAEKVIFQLVQKETYSELLKQLMSKSSKRHNLSNLAPFIGEDGLIRVGGRLKYSAIPYEGKHQVLLPEKHHVTEILVRKLHEENHHVGQGGLLAIIRERYWPVKVKSVIKKTISKCQVCGKCNPIPGTQFMGNIPESRVNPAPVFSKVGIDYAGPFMLKLGGRSPKLYKAYVVVFVCMAIKAIHFEVVSNLTSDNFIAALHRFVGRRGLPSDIYSDNGTAFVGANHELVALKQLFEDQQHQRKLEEFCAVKGICWHFIPPRSPHFGGIWEAGVKSMKHHLKRVVGETKLTFEELTTFLAQAEAVLNSRPLIPVSDDPNDLSVLTPFHFLIGRSGLTVPEPSYKDVGRLSRWQHIQSMQQHFWTRWSKEYLHHLQTRQKWNSAVQQINVGALVLLLDENLPPQQWRRGRIAETHPGDDGVVRVVTVHTTTGDYKRAVTKIAFLPSVEIENSTGGEC
ncbi:uncharacterized protein LOC115264003 [Aedes albopictus]|uniref:Integrase catalytic domain-containing protein n=1 Tax=Aedes albopictus TaxID=7160 RepID=A0ABM1YFC2_AEDAL